jgi:hypothetical protein
MRLSLLLREAIPLRPTVNPANRPMMLITTNNSTSVNARKQLRFFERFRNLAGMDVKLSLAFAGFIVVFS